MQKLTAVAVAFAAALLILALAACASTEQQEPGAPAQPAPAAPAMAPAATQQMQPKAPQQPEAAAPAMPAAETQSITKAAGETPAKVLDRPMRPTPVPPTAMEIEEAKYGGSLKWIPNGGVAGVDPIRGGPLSLTTAYSVHDWLVAWDADGQLQPQMLDTWEIEDDGKKITLTLRDGLLFHDLSPVTSADIVQSIHRWREKALFGKSYFNEKLISLDAVDDKTIVANFTEPSGVFIQGIGDPSAPSPIMVPAEQAMVPPTEQMPDNIGAGVYKMAAIDVGNKVIWNRFMEYNPRSEPASFRAGGKHGYIDVVTGLEVPEAQTRVAALLTGQADFLDVIPPDFITKLENEPGIEVLISRPGAQYFVNINKAAPLFGMTEKGQYMRKALQTLTDNDEIMAGFGPSKMWMTCASMWACGTRYGNDTVAPELYNQKNIELAKDYLDKAGYDGEPVKLLGLAGYGSGMSTFNEIYKQQMERAGIVVDFKVLDSAARRAYIDEVGEAEAWHIGPTYMTSWSWRPIASHYSSNVYGYESDRMVAARTALASASDPAMMQEYASEMQRVFFEEVPYVLAGHAFFLRAMNSNLDGYIDMPIDGVYMAELHWTDR